MFENKQAEHWASLAGKYEERCDQHHTRILRKNVALQLLRYELDCYVMEKAIPKETRELLKEKLNKIEAI